MSFVEVSGVTRRPIGTVNGGGRGTLRFTPAPGSDVRHIEAQFTLDGIRAETRTVASFRPPPARLGRARAPARAPSREHADRQLAARCRAPPGTSSSRLRRAPASGSCGRAARTRTLRRVALTSAGRISVRATAPMRVGAPATARFRATRHLKTRFAVLPRAPRALRHG